MKLLNPELELSVVRIFSPVFIGIHNIKESSNFLSPNLVLLKDFFVRTIDRKEDYNFLYEVKMFVLLYYRQS